MLALLALPPMPALTGITQISNSSSVGTPNPHPSCLPSLRIGHLACLTHMHTIECCDRAAEQCYSDVVTPVCLYCDNYDGMMEQKSHHGSI